MKLQVSPLISDIIISVYILITLYIRFEWENSNRISTPQSIAVGLSFVVFIWALIKLKVLNPNWFGLFSAKKSKP